MRNQPYTVVVETEMREVHADSPLRAALSAVALYKADRLDDCSTFVYACVFVGKTPDCIHNPKGIYCL